MLNTFQTSNNSEYIPGSPEPLTVQQERSLEVQGAAAKFAAVLEADIRIDQEFLDSLQVRSEEVGHFASVQAASTVVQYDRPSQLDSINIDAGNEIGGNNVSV